VAARAATAGSLPAARRGPLGGAGTAVRRLGADRHLVGERQRAPPFSLLLDPVLETYPGRLLGWLAWLGVGRWLVTR